METNESIVILNFAEAKQPEYRERKKDGIIEFGERNNYPEYLLDLFNKSAKHNAIVRGKVNYIIGNGWKGDESPATKQFIENVNRFENLDDLTRKISVDIELFGGAFLEIIWSMTGMMIAEIYHVDYTKIRSNRDGTQFFYKNDWSNPREREKIFSCFNPKVPSGSQILYLKEYRPGLQCYALPGYLGALNYIESDVEVSKHVLGNAQTGFSASKMITLPNGEPTPDEKSNIERRFEKRFTGSDGKKFILSFVNDSSRKPIIDDLGTSDLTKEDFGRVDSMIQQNIFAGHQLTSPSLFGISEPGKLGTRTEIRDAYEVFKNTYVNDKQRFIESAINKLAKYSNVSGELKIIPVEPIGFEFTEQTLVAIAPKQWLLDKAGIDAKQYEPIPGETGTVQNADVNENIKNLTGRQHQQILRIIRQFGQGKITREIATTMLRTGLGLSDDDISTMLGANEFSDDFSDDDVVQMFSEHGTSKNEFDVIGHQPTKFAGDVVIDDLIDKRLLYLVQRDPLISTKDLARAVQITESDVRGRIENLKNLDILKSTDNGWELSQPVSELIDKKPKTVFQVMYSYEWKPQFHVSDANKTSTPLIQNSRPFCQKMLDLDRYYSRREIEMISGRLGYSVFDRAGGWWGKSPSCRHYWRTNVVVKK